MPPGLIATRGPGSAPLKVRPDRVVRGRVVRAWDSHHYDCDAWHKSSPQGTGVSPTGGDVGSGRHNRAVKLRRLREGDVLEDGATVLVRGRELDPNLLREDAVRYHSIYGVYGISVFAIRGVTLEEMAQQVPLVRFERHSAEGRGCCRGQAAAGGNRPQPAPLHRRL